MEQIRETPGSFLPTSVTVTQVMNSWTLQDGYPGAHRHKSLQRRLRHRLAGQKIEHRD